MAKKYRPRYVKASKVAQEAQKAPERSGQPRQIGTKFTRLDGELYPVRVFEASGPEPETSPARQPLFSSLDDSALAIRPNRTNYVLSMDVLQALETLPQHWAVALLLVYEHGYTRSETAEMFGISIKALYKTFGRARKRLRFLLPGYTLKRKVKAKAPTKKPKVKVSTKPAVSDPNLPPRKGPGSVSVPERDESRKQPNQVVMGKGG